MGVAQKSRQEVDGERVRSSQLSPHIILTFPHKYILFSNREHTDNDCICSSDAELFWNYVNNSSNLALKD